jgi:predicted nucleic acid-binding protein
MPLVIDCSVMVALCFDEEQSQAAEKALDLVKTDGGIVPALWWFELRNVLLVGERRGRITKERTAAFLEDVERLSIEIDREPSSNDLFDLARRYQLTGYDAAYLELAKRHSAPFATFDQALVTAAKKLKIRLAL